MQGEGGARGHAAEPDSNDTALKTAGGELCAFIAPDANGSGIPGCSRPVQRGANPMAGVGFFAAQSPIRRTWLRIRHAHTDRKPGAGWPSERRSCQAMPRVIWAWPRSSVFGQSSLRHGNLLWRHPDRRPQQAGGLADRLQSHRSLGSQRIQAGARRVTMRLVAGPAHRPRPDAPAQARA